MAADTSKSAVWIPSGLSCQRLTELAIASLSCVFRFYLMSDLMLITATVSALKAKRAEVTISALTYSETSGTLKPSAFVSQLGVLALTFAIKRAQMERFYLYTSAPPDWTGSLRRRASIFLSRSPPPRPQPQLRRNKLKKHRRGNRVNGGQPLPPPPTACSSAALTGRRPSVLTSADPLRSRLTAANAPTSVRHQR